MVWNCALVPGILNSPPHLIGDKPALACLTPPWRQEPIEFRFVMLSTECFDYAIQKGPSKLWFVAHIYCPSTREGAGRRLLPLQGKPGPVCLKKKKKKNTTKHNQSHWLESVWRLGGEGVSSRTLLPAYRPRRPLGDSSQGPTVWTSEEAIVWLGCRRNVRLAKSSHAWWFLGMGSPGNPRGVGHG